MIQKSFKSQPWALKVVAARFRAHRFQLLDAPRPKIQANIIQNDFEMCAKWSREGLNITSSRFSASLSEAILGAILGTVLETNLKEESSTDLSTDVLCLMC